MFKLNNILQEYMKKKQILMFKNYNIQLKQNCIKYIK